MAMIECPECKLSVSDMAASCPNCGHPIAGPAQPPQMLQVPQQTPPPEPAKKKSGCLKLGCAIVAGIFLLLLIIGLLSGDRPRKNTEAAPGAASTTTATATVKTAATETTAPEPVVPTSEWSYSQLDDPMANGRVYHASVRSTNTVDFAFPYSGIQHATLTLRTHPRYGKDVIFSIEKGQIPCPSFSPCKVLVRFDEGQSVNYGAVNPEDNSRETIFIRDYNGFVAKMLKAKKVRISANIYQEGAPAFEFPVEGFEADKYRPAGK